MVTNDVLNDGKDFSEGKLVFYEFLGCTILRRSDQARII